MGKVDLNETRLPAVVVEETRASMTLVLLAFREIIRARSYSDSTR